jgi:hypothetical protein
LSFSRKVFAEVFLRFGDISSPSETILGEWNEVYSSVRLGRQESRIIMSQLKNWIVARTDHHRQEYWKMK